MKTNVCLSVKIIKMTSQGHGLSDSRLHPSLRHYKTHFNKHTSTWKQKTRFIMTPVLCSIRKLLSKTTAQKQFLEEENLFANKRNALWVFKTN